MSNIYLKIFQFPTFPSLYAALVKAMEFEGGRDPGVILKQRFKDTTGFYKNLFLLLACFDCLGFY